MRFNNAATEIPKLVIDQGSFGKVHITGTIKRTLNDDDIGQLPNGEIVRPAIEAARDAAQQGITRPKEVHTTDVELPVSEYRIWPVEGEGSAEFPASGSKVKVTIAKGQAVAEWSIDGWVTPKQLEVLGRCIGKNSAAMLDIGEAVQTSLTDMQDTTVEISFDGKTTGPVSVDKMNQVLKGVPRG